MVKAAGIFPTNPSFFLVLVMGPNRRVALVLALSVDHVCADYCLSVPGDHAYIPLYVCSEGVVCLWEAVTCF